MIRQRISPLDWLIIFFLSVSFCISNFHLFFNGVYSPAPMYKVMNGWVSWWTIFVGLMINVAWLALMAIVLGLNKTRLNPKQACMMGAYLYGLYRDIFDWFHGNYIDTKYKDWIITVMLFAFVQFLFWTIKKFRNST